MYDKNEYFKFICKKNNVKLREYLKEEGISSRYYREVTKEAFIKVNDKITKNNKALKKGDEIFVKIPEEKYNASIEKGEIHVLYEDEDVIVVNKEPYMVTHTAKEDISNTLLNYACYYFKTKDLKRKVRFANRLDRDTSGIVIICKNAFAHFRISEQFSQDEVIKNYIAITEDNFKEKSGIIEEPIIRTDDGIKRAVSPEGKYCKTGYEVLKSNGKFAIVKLRLYTGRTHQIRVHLSHMGCSIIGDSLYGEESEFIERQALHSSHIEFLQPRSGEKIIVDAPLFQDMKKLKEIVDRL